MLNSAYSTKEIKLNTQKQNTTQHNIPHTSIAQAIHQANASVDLEGFTISPPLQADFALLIKHQISLDQVISNTTQRHQSSHQKTNISKVAPVVCESDFTRVRILALKLRPVEGNFNADHLKAINRRILQDMSMYNGGTLRLDTHEHVRSRSINQGADSYVVHYKHGGVNDDAINRAIQKAGSIEALSQLSHARFCEKLAELYGDLDYIHSFNEANSRTLRLFTEQLAYAAGQDLDWARIFTLDNPRDAVYMARDLAVSKRSFPNLSIETMRYATPSEFEAYETQKKLADIQSMCALMQSCLIKAHTSLDLS